MKTSHSPVACRGGLLAKLLVLLAALFAVIALVWMAFLPMIIGRVVAAKTGFTVKIESLYVNPFTACADLKGLVVQNPADFPCADFVELRRFKVDLALASLLSDRLVVEEAMVDLPRISIVKDRNGRSNLDVLRAAFPAGQEPAAKPTEKPAAAGSARKFLIKRLELNIGKVVFADYSGGSARTREVPLNIDHTYTDATTVAELAAPIAPAIVAAGLSGALGALPGPVGDVLGGTFNAATGTIQSVGQKTTGALKGFFEKLEEKTKP